MADILDRNLNNVGASGQQVLRRDNTLLRFICMKGTKVDKLLQVYEQGLSEPAISHSLSYGVHVSDVHVSVFHFLWHAPCHVSMYDEQLLHMFRATFLDQSEQVLNQSVVPYTVAFSVLPPSFSRLHLASAAISGSGTCFPGIHERCTKCG